MRHKYIDDGDKFIFFLACTYLFLCEQVWNNTSKGRTNFKEIAEQDLNWGVKDFMNFKQKLILQISIWASSFPRKAFLALGPNTYAATWKREGKGNAGPSEDMFPKITPLSN